MRGKQVEEGPHDVDFWGHASRHRQFPLLSRKKGSLKLTECVARGYEMKIRSSNDRVTDTPVMDSG